jgi:hypothetical protein
VAVISNPQIVFVYAMRSGMINKIKAWARGIYAPQAPHCRLYALTHNAWGMDREWRHFYRLLPMPKQDWYLDQMQQLTPKVSVNAPGILLQPGGGSELIELISETEITACESISDLRKLLISKLNLATDFELLGITFN